MWGPRRLSSPRRHSVDSKSSTSPNSVLGRNYFCFSLLLLIFFFFLMGTIGLFAYYCCINRGRILRSIMYQKSGLACVHKTLCRSSIFSYSINLLWSLTRFQVEQIAHCARRSRHWNKYLPYIETSQIMEIGTGGRENSVQEWAVSACHPTASTTIILRVVI